MIGSIFKVTSHGAICSVSYVRPAFWGVVCMALPMMIQDGLQDRTNLLEAYGYMEIVEVSWQFPSSKGSIGQIMRDSSAP